MKSLVLKSIKQPLEMEVRDSLEPEPGKLVVEVRAAAFNRRDFWITQGMYPGIKLPVVLGSDGAGVVHSVGADVDEELVGQSVIVNPGMGWGNSTRAQSGDFQILGMPQDGTFAEQVVVDAEYVHAAPSHLGWTQAAALPLAGLTAFRAVFVQGKLEPGQKVLVTGIGGGVATFALQFAKLAGAEVIVTSSSQMKLDKAQEIGAIGGFNYKEEDWAKRMVQAHGNVDLVIDSAAGRGYADLLDVVGFGGRIVNYGATTGPPEKLDMFKVFWKQLTLQGSTMGSPGDFASMVKFVEENQMVPAIDTVLDFSAANEGLARMQASEQFGKIVLNVNEG